MNGVVWIIYLAFVVLSIAGLWCVFAKAGEDGWKAIIPIWNTMPSCSRIVGRPVWWIVLFLIPLVNIIIWIIVANDLSKSFARGAGTTVGLVLLVADLRHDPRLRQRGLPGPRSPARSSPRQAAI